MLLQLCLIFLPLPILALNVGFGSLQQCIPQNPPGQRQVLTPSYEDCITAIITWGNLPSRDKPTTFSRDASKGYKLPHEITIGDCVFEIDLVSPTRDQTASIKNIAREAGMMAKKCVLKGHHTGGVAYVGPNSMLEIVLHGRQDRLGNSPFPRPGWSLGPSIDVGSNITSLFKT